MKSIGCKPELKDFKRHFCCFFGFIGWDNISLGLNIDLLKPNIEIHIPFGFIKIGWTRIDVYDEKDGDTKRVYFRSKKLLKKLNKRYFGKNG